MGSVPPDIELCEFDCRKNQCLTEDWSACERRLSRAAGELMPKPISAVRNETNEGDSR